MQYDLFPLRATDNKTNKQQTKKAKRRLNREGKDQCQNALIKDPLALGCVTNRKGKVSAKHPIRHMSYEERRQVTKQLKRIELLF